MRFSIWASIAAYACILVPDATVSAQSFYSVIANLDGNGANIPVDGSTITVVVDGAPVGNATYNNFRSDIADLFPGYANTTGAIGFRVLDTTALANGAHTIAWIVTDNEGMAEGIGSRYFSGSNGVGSITAAVKARATAANPLSVGDIELLPLAAAARWHGVAGIWNVP